MLPLFLMVMGPVGCTTDNPFGDPPLPGLKSKLVPSKMKEALIAQPQGYTPRTHHLTPAGQPKYINRLIFESSPYLLQHAHNPVNWYAWSDAAFMRAQKENKLVLLSIGYSTCHWCHVMERESFENETIAAYLNQHFIAIKVDREERPDLDSIYMSAVRHLKGGGGWPLTAILTPQRHAVFGGTYFPPTDRGRGGRPGFLSILERMHTSWQQEPNKLKDQGQNLTAKLAQQPHQPVAGVPDVQILGHLANSMARRFDPIDGGFGGAPKFPRPAALDFLLRYHRRTQDPQALAIVVKTLEAMATGGIYDHVGGGFHRYSTDPKWLVPHFEKMLYDNAQLVMTYVDAYQITHREDFRKVATDTLDYVLAEMAAPGGTFYSATDADSADGKGHMEEGLFFTWTPMELQAALPKPELDAVVAYYGITPRGNFEGRNIFSVTRSRKDVATGLGISVDVLDKRLQAAKSKLYQLRSKRLAPLRDDKMIVAWNALMISAFARAGFVLNEPKYTKTAVRAVTDLRAKAFKHGHVYRTWKDGRLGARGFLDDYAFLVQALLDVYEASADAQWLMQAKEVQKIQDSLFTDNNRGGYFFVDAPSSQKLLMRDKPGYDGAVPAGNSVALLNLLRLHSLTGEKTWQAGAQRTLQAFSRAMLGGGMPKMLTALDYWYDTPLEVVIVEPTQPDPKTSQALLAQLRTTFLPNRIIVRVQEGENLRTLEKTVPLLASKKALHGKTTAFVCRNKVCDLPTSDPSVLRQQLIRRGQSKVNFASLPVVTPTPPPAPWYHDVANNRHWHPGHHHWHPGAPPTGKR